MQSGDPKTGDPKTIIQVMLGWNFEFSKEELLLLGKSQREFILDQAIKSE